MTIEPYTGPRAQLRGLFELAEDSPLALDAYIETGEVLVAIEGGEIVGHIQLTPASSGATEIKNMAVAPAHQGRGIGRALIDAAGGPLVVATAAADVGNLRFYQRAGFRLHSIERDAFTPANGYPAGLRIDGIELRDRVWLDRR